MMGDASPIEVSMKDGGKPIRVTDSAAERVQDRAAVRERRCNRHSPQMWCGGYRRGRFGAHKAFRRRRGSSQDASDGVALPFHENVGIFSASIGGFDDIRRGSPLLKLCGVKNADTQYSASQHVA